MRYHFPMIPGHVHFVGLCGAGMSAVARLHQEAGWRVTGSDEGFYPPIADVVRRYGIPCATPYRAENLPDSADTVVIGRHARLVPETNPEVAAAFARRDAGTLRILSFPQALAALTARTENVVVAGSFGKSSCSALAAWVLRHAGVDPGWFVGAEAPDLADNGRLGAGRLFVLEGDEYPAANDDPRSKFLFYAPRHLLLTSGEHDHVNVFPTLESYLAPFRQLVALVPDQGRIVACADGAHLRRVLDAARAPVTRYARGPRPDADWWAENVAFGETTRFTLVHRGATVAAIRTRLLGEHNVENVVGVAALLLGGGWVGPDAFADAVAAFTGVRRRLERLTPDSALPVYSDFGSSRAKCRAGIATLRAAFPDRRLTVCFEPHTFSFRSRDALHWYDDLFAGADRVLIHHPPEHGAHTHDQLARDQIVARVAAAGIDAAPVDDADHLLRLLDGADPARDLIVFETSGGFDGAIPRVVERILHG